MVSLLEHLSGSCKIFDVSNTITPTGMQAEPTALLVPDLGKKKPI